MKQVSLWAIAGASLMLAGNAFGGGPVDKGTGEFSIAGCYECVPGDPLGLIRYRLVSAHEGNGRRDQKGFLYSEVDGNWYLIDFDDTENTCVNVFEDGSAYIGGLVSDGNVGAVGKYFGYDISDGGQPDPAVYNDTMWVLRFDSPVDPKTDFFNWCNGYLPIGPATWWPQAVVEGNVKVHNYPGDAD